MKITHIEIFIRETRYRLTPEEFKKLRYEVNSLNPNLFKTKENYDWRESQRLLADFDLMYAREIRADWARKIKNRQEQQSDPKTV